MSEWPTQHELDAKELGAYLALCALRKELAKLPPEERIKRASEEQVAERALVMAKYEAHLHDAIETKLDQDEAEIDALTQALQSKDAAYHERNQLVAWIASMFSSSLELHPEEDTTWDKNWRNIVYIDTPAGQLSWHLRDDELPLFNHVPRLQGRTWDGHTTEEKYGRIQALIVLEDMRRDLIEASTHFVGEPLTDTQRQVLARMSKEELAEEFQSILGDAPESEGE